jgi:hypothetical protein
LSHEAISLHGLGSRPFFEEASKLQRGNNFNTRYPTEMDARQLQKPSLHFYCKIVKVSKFPVKERICCLQVTPSIGIGNAARATPESFDYEFC